VYHPGIWFVHGKDGDIVSLLGEVVYLVENETLRELRKPIEIIQNVHMLVLAKGKKNCFDVLKCLGTGYDGWSMKLEPHLANHSLWSKV
jgi:hypothetical protein